MRSILPFPAVVLLGLPLSAQLTVGTLTDGNVVVRTTGFPPSISSTTALFQDFRVTGTAGTDHLYASNWYWRLDTDPREYALHNGTSQGARSSTYTGNTVVHTWADVDNRGFAATLSAQAFSTGPASGMVVQKLTFTNNTAAPVNVNLFAYVDYDQCGAFNNSATANPNGNKQSVSDPACTAIGEAFAPGADLYEATNYRTVGNKLTDALANTLTNTGLPYGTGDYTSAWQWQDRPVGPGGSFTAYFILAQDFVHSGCTGVASAATSGTGKAGTNGVPAFDASALPFLGRAITLRVSNGVGGSAPFVILGSAALNLPFPPIGTILVDPVGAATFFGAPFDGSNVSSTPLQIPNVASLCAATLHLQDFHFDAGAAGSIAHSDRLTWVLGGVN